MSVILRANLLLTADIRRSFAWEDEMETKITVSCDNPVAFEARYPVR